MGSVRNPVFVMTRVNSTFVFSVTLPDGTAVRCSVAVLVITVKYRKGPRQVLPVPRVVVFVAALLEQELRSGSQAPRTEVLDVCP